MLIRPPSLTSGSESLPFTQVHPSVKLTWGIVSIAYGVSMASRILAVNEVRVHSAHRFSSCKQIELIQLLTEEMDESCGVAQDAAPPRDQSKRSDEIVVEILLQVIRCTYFVKEYCGDRRFGMHGYIQRSKRRVVNGVYLGSRLLRDMAPIVERLHRGSLEIASQS